MPQENYDFSGYATRANVVCSDGRVIDPQAFKHMDGKTVPLLWHHNFQDPKYVLGNAKLEWREDGMYTYASLNGLPKAIEAGELLKHSDVGAFSVHGYNLVHDASQRVLKGDIKEVSIVISGANPGAKIEDVFLHSDMGAMLIDDEAYFTFATEFKHADTTPISKEDDVPKDVGTALNTLSPEQKSAFETLLVSIDKVSNGDGETANQIFEEYGGEEKLTKTLETLNQYQLAAVQQSVLDVLESNASDENNTKKTMTHDNMGKGDSMSKEIKRNLFEGVNEVTQNEINTATFVHADMVKVIKAAKAQNTSVKAIVKQYKNEEFKHAGLVVDPDSLETDEITTLQHASSLGNPEILFPDAMLLNRVPKEMEKQYDKWVRVTLSKIAKLPYSRVKTLFSDVNYETARAKGYIKASMKKNDFYKWSKRVTQPTTVYKKEMMDRDDMIDVSATLDIVAYVKAIMRKKMDYELARAAIFGDGRAIDDADKINEECIRPVMTDVELFTTTTEIVFPAEDSDYNYVRALEKAFLNAHVTFNGTGTPDVYMSPFSTTRILLAEDKQGRYLYDTDMKFRNRTKIGELLETTIIGDLYLDEAKTKQVVAIMTSLQDYNFGSDKGGSLAMFDDFDIDYNQNKYLLETRLSGASTQAKSTVVFYRTVTQG